MSAVNANFVRWMYHGRRPNWLARRLNRIWAAIGALGVAPNYFVTLEVTGRQSGRTISFPLVMVVQSGQRYLVSMLGERTQWVRNVRANDGKAVIHSGGRQVVLLEEVPIAQRAPILKAFLRRAPGARPHIPVNKNAPLAEFERIAAAYPVFRVATLRQG